MIEEVKKEMEETAIGGRDYDATTSAVSHVTDGVESHVTDTGSRDNSEPPDDFDIPVLPEYLESDEDIMPLISPVSTDIDNLGSCPCCSQDLTVSLVHHNTGLITCNNLDCIYPFNKESILGHFIHIPTNRILRETADRMKSLQNLSLKTIGIIDRDLRC